MKKTNKLTVFEWNLLQRLSSKARMDWFWLDTDEDDRDYIWDLEEHEELTLKEGILQLDEGLTDLDDYGLNAREKQIYKELIKKVKDNYYGK